MKNTIPKRSLYIKKFFQIFKKYKRIDSISENNIISNKPDILFKLAGIVPFIDLISYKKIKNKTKQYFLSSIQKCIRLNDIENIGDNTHLTSFEMLGIFSINKNNFQEIIGKIFEFVYYFFNISKDISVTISKESEFLDLIYQYQKKYNFNITIIEKQIWSYGKEGLRGESIEVFFKDLEILNCVIINSFIKDNKEIFLDEYTIDLGIGLERFIYKENFFKLNPSLNFFFNKSIDNEKDLKIFKDFMRTTALLLHNEIIISNFKRGYYLKFFLKNIVYLCIKYKIENLFIFNKLFSNIIDWVDNTKIKPLYIKYIKDFIIKQRNNLAKHITQFKQNEKNLKNLSFFFLTKGLNAFIIKDLIKAETNKNDILLSFNSFLKKHKDISRVKKKYNLKNKYDNLSSDNKTIFLYNCLEKIIDVIDCFFDENYLYIGLKENIFFFNQGGQANDRGIILFLDLNLNNSFIINSYIMKNQILYLKFAIKLFKDIKLIYLKNELKRIKMIIDKKSRSLIAQQHSIIHIVCHILEKRNIKIINTKALHSRSEINIDRLYNIGLKELQIYLKDSLNNFFIKNNSDITSIDFKTFSKSQNLSYKSIKQWNSYEIVRCVRIGESKELCCGTHINKLSDISIYKLKICNYSKRIKIIIFCGNNAIRYYKNKEQQLSDLRKNLTFNILNKSFDNFQDLIDKNKILEFNNNLENKINKIISENEKYLVSIKNLLLEKLQNNLNILYFKIINIINIDIKFILNLIIKNIIKNNIKFTFIFYITDTQKYLYCSNSSIFYKNNSIIILNIKHFINYKIDLVFFKKNEQ